MAKTKKLTKKEHENLKDTLDSVRLTKNKFDLAASNFADAMSAFNEANEASTQAQVTLNKMQVKLMDKYGKVNVNVDTGELTDIPEEDVQEPEGNE